MFLQSSTPLSGHAEILLPSWCASLNPEDVNRHESKLPNFVGPASLVRPSDQRAHPDGPILPHCHVQGLMKAEGKARYGSQFSKWQKQASEFQIDNQTPVRWPLPALEGGRSARICWGEGGGL